jgi:hypothetical protein
MLGGIVPALCRFIRKFGCRGVGPSGQFQHCWGIAVDDPLGLVYVVDKDNHRVQLFDAEGAFLTKFGTMGDGANQFNHRRPNNYSLHPFIPIHLFQLSTLPSIRQLVSFMWAKACIINH